MKPACILQVEMRFH